MRQINPGSDEPSRLNQASLSGMSPNVQILNVVSTGYAIESPTSGRPSHVEPTVVDGLSHTDFVSALGSAFRTAKRGIYAR